MATNAPNGFGIEPAKPGQTNVIPHVRDIHTYAVTDTEIEDLCSEHMSIDFGLSTLFGGILVAVIVALVTTEMSERVFSGFIGAAIAAFVLTVYFGVKTYRGRRRVEKRLNEIKEKSK